jgi:hypothetical protein
MHIPMHIKFLKVGRCDGEKLHAMASLLTNSGDRGGGRESQRWLGVVFQDGGNTATWQKLGRIKFRWFARDYDPGFPIGVLQPGSILYLPFAFQWFFAKNKLTSILITLVPWPIQQ